MRLLLFVIISCLFSVVSLQAQAGMIDYKIVKLQVLDKSTARTKTIEAKVGETVQYGSVFIKAQACRKSEPLDKPESASFLQIWEVPINADLSEWVFSGWMFASSPALSAMDHAVYDVWVLDCLEPTKKEIVIKEDEPSEEKTNSALKPKITVEGEDLAEDLGETREQTIEGGLDADTVQQNSPKVGAEGQGQALDLEEEFDDSDMDFE